MSINGLHIGGQCPSHPLSLRDKFMLVVYFLIGTSPITIVLLGTAIDIYQRLTQ